MIYTKSKFIYGHSVDLTNKYIPFDEGAGELIAEIAEGDFSFGEFAAAVQDALNSAGLLTYTVAIDRDSSRLTISASGNFEFLTFTGTGLGTSAFALMGFSYPAADLTGDDSYSSNTESGSTYVPQFFLQSYVPPENFQESVGAVINESADGRVEVVRFGVKNKIEMDIKFITNLPMDGINIRNNPTGLQDALDFFGNITQKTKFEFIPDLLTTSTFHKVILESMSGSSDGTGFKLKELFADSLPDIYETGVFTLRVVA